ncbi:DUF397 domain-containing protein [Nocardia blacklockiae]|uniref:DUF397 domain-containing protein n=1 Tax=Nocardia blacklockiae TaxID=480036 RepID=UPI0018960C78|nr:DUF397 domain-containing protein [Nocardia blacklockiae]MBF6176101.1 DUF397 domain-containing protein [Nocardia blacklockiae]
MPSTVRYRPEATGWFTSTRTNNGNQCVEVRFDGAAVQVRDSKYRRDPARRPADEPVLTVTAGEWMDFLDGLRGRRSNATGLVARTAADGTTTLTSGGLALTYTPGEWAAFVAGVRDGEFDRVPV